MGLLVRRLLHATWSWLLIRDRWATVLMLAIFTVLILSGATTSSIGMASLTQDPADPLTVQLGHAQWIRSDEYNVGTPIALSIMSTGGDPTLSPLGAPANIAHRYSSGGFFENVVFFQSAILRLGTFLPQQMVFSLYWWLPIIVLFLALPVWMQQIGANRRLGWLAALLIAFTPAAAWWSELPIQTIAYTIAGCAVLISAYRRLVEKRYVWFSVLAIASGLLLAGIPTFYQPWSIVVGVPFLLATVLWILTRRTSWQSRIFSVAASGAVALVFAAGVFIENFASVQAMLGTVYPGQRRSTAIAQGFDFLFGGPGLAVLRNADPIASNASELSTAFTVTLVWAAIVIVARRSFGPRESRIVAITFASAAAVWAGWVMVDLGGLGAHIPILNLVPAPRAAQVVGILGIVVLCIALSGLPVRNGLRLPLIAAVPCAVITAYALSLLRQNYLPDLSILHIALATIGTAIAVFVVTWRPRSLWSIVVASGLAASVVIVSQPILFGLSDLRDSTTAKRLAAIGKEARADGTMWATDAGSFDAVMLANGVPALSGYQRSGPDSAEWKKLDPTGEFETAWNRGGGYIPFLFTPGEPTSITTNGFDVTFVTVDPCTLHDAFPDLTRIASASTLTEPCLVPEEDLEWSGQTIHTYSFVDAP